MIKINISRLQFAKIAQKVDTYFTIILTMTTSYMSSAFNLLFMLTMTFKLLNDANKFFELKITFLEPFFNQTFPIP
jgi:uncharacterized protein YybS (DUF2232 family)